jgi:hypothetical protein
MEKDTLTEPRVSFLAPMMNDDDVRFADGKIA